MGRALAWRRCGVAPWAHKGGAPCPVRRTSLFALQRAMWVQVGGARGGHGGPAPPDPHRRTRRWARVRVCASVQALAGRSEGVQAWSTGTSLRLQCEQGHRGQARVLRCLSISTCWQLLLNRVRTDLKVCPPGGRHKVGCGLLRPPGGCPHAWSRVLRGFSPLPFPWSPCGAWRWPLGRVGLG